MILFVQTFSVNMSKLQWGGVGSEPILSIQTFYVHNIQRGVGVIRASDNTRSFISFMASLMVSIVFPWFLDKI